MNKGKVLELTIQGQDQQVDMENFGTRTCMNQIEEIAVSIENNVQCLF